MELIEECRAILPGDWQPDPQRNGIAGQAGPYKLWVCPSESMFTLGSPPNKAGAWCAVIVVGASAKFCVGHDGAAALRALIASGASGV